MRKNFSSDVIIMKNCNQCLQESMRYLFTSTFGLPPALADKISKERSRFVIVLGNTQVSSFFFLMSVNNARSRRFYSL